MNLIEIQKKPIVYAGSALRPFAGDPGWPAEIEFTDVGYAKALAENIAFAERMCHAIALAGGVPYAPHLLFPRFFDDAKQEERDLSIGCGLRMITVCDEAWFFVPPWRRDLSNGMKAEREFAEKLGIPTRVCMSEAAFLLQIARLTHREVLARPLPALVAA